MKSELFFDKESQDKIINEPINSKLFFKEGLGVDTTLNTPVRLLSYIIPLITNVQKFTESNGQIYIAENGIIRNGANSQIIRENAQNMKKTIQYFH